MAVAVPVLVVARSAVGGVRTVTTVAPGALPLLLAGLESGVADVLLAVLLTLRRSGETKLIVLATAGAPESMLIAGNVTIPVVEL